MRLKSFYAKTMSDAMKIVRDTLGEDAIIVATREEAGGKAVSVTAAVDNDSYAKHKQTTDRIQRFLDEVDAGQVQEDDELEQVDPPASLRSDNQDHDWLFDNELGDDADNTAIVEALTDVMIRHGASSEVTDEILSCASVMGLEDPRVSLVAALENLYDFRPLPKTAARRALMMIGPPGSGKTLAAAKLAARSVMSDLQVKMITTDVVRAGGVEQLQSFTNILNVDLDRASSADELGAKLKNAQGADQVIIDTAGTNPFDPQDMRRLSRLIAVGSIEPVLVLPAGVDAHESSDMARTFGAIGAKWLLPTRLDIGRRLGGILTAAHQAGLTFADASNTAQVAEGLVELDPRKLADFLLPKQKGKEQTRSGSSSPTQSSPSGLSARDTALKKRAPTKAG